MHALRLTLAAALLSVTICEAQTLNPAPIFTPATTARAKQLIAKMTTDEKLSQLTQLFYFKPDAAVDADIAAGKVGSALFVTDPAEINRLQHLAVDGSRLHIPLIFGFDVIHGFRTIFPAPLGAASSWDPVGIERTQSIAASEARSVGIAWAFAPMVDIARDPRWGRTVEGAGEDPYLGAAIARAQVHGFQGAVIGAPGHVMTSVKHFAGYGAAEGGRDYDASYISDAEMQNVYLPPFRAAIEAGSGTVMSAYMDLNDVPATGNSFLLMTCPLKSQPFEAGVLS
jgi:beta-glucosidase